MAYVARLRALLPVLGLWLVAACTTTSGTGKIYRVKVETGDSLASIAMQYDTTWQKIAKLNGITGTGQMKVGDVLRVEPGPGGIIATDGNIRVQKSEPAAPARATAPTKRRGLLFDGDNSAAASESGTIGDTDLNWPLYGQLSSHYGRRGHRQHQGIDIRAKYGTPVLAAGKGVVEFAGRQNGYGRTIIVRHGKYKTLYAHLSSIDVRRGEKVDQHTEIGKVGTSGRTTGPHLHFEIRKLDNVAINPLTVLERSKLLSSSH